MLGSVQVQRLTHRDSPEKWKPESGSKFLYFALFLQRVVDVMLLKLKCHNLEHNKPFFSDDIIPATVKCPISTGSFKIHQPDLPQQVGLKNDRIYFSQTEAKSS